MRSTTPFRALIGAAAVLLAVSGCSADETANADTITIGASLPLTGEFSQGGLDTQHGYETWVDLTNENGGLLDKDVKIVVKDDATTQDTAVSNYNNLISKDKVDLVLGSQSSLLNIPASAIAEKNKMLFVCPSCGSPDMFIARLQLHLLLTAGHRHRSGQGVRRVDRRICPPISGRRPPRTPRWTTPSPGRWSRAPRRSFPRQVSRPSTRTSTRRRRRTSTRWSTR